MKTTVLDKVVEEVKLIPTEKLPEILDIIHYFRVGVQASNAKKNRTKNFAGCWRDMPDDLYHEFIHEIILRRRTAFSRRQSPRTR